MPLLSIAPLRGHWFAVGVRDPQHRSLQQRGLLIVRSGLNAVWSGRFVASAFRRWSPTPLCDTLGCVHPLSDGFHRGLRPRRDSLVRPGLLGGHRFLCFSLSSDFSD